MSFKLNADDAALKDFQPGDRIHAGARPVAHVGTDAETLVAVLDEREDVVGIPKFVVRFVGPFRMAMNARRNVVFLISFSIKLIWSGDGSMVMAGTPASLRNQKTFRAPASSFGMPTTPKFTMSRPCCFALALSVAIVSSVAFRLDLGLPVFRAE